MKQLFHSPLFSTALNAATRTLNAAYGAFQELSVPEGSQIVRFRLSPFGEFPVKDVHGRDIVQVVDAEAGDTMAANFSSLSSQVATFFRGVPMYEGHADDEDWLKKNPGHKASAVARIKTIQNEADGIWATATLNSAGVELLGGEAPRYTGHSPHWRLTPIPGRPGHFRPILLWSTALTNTPNIVQNAIALNSLQGVSDEDADPSPDAGKNAGESETNTETNTEMQLTPEALQALGFAPDATPSPEEINAAIIKLASEKADADAKKTTAEGATAAANTRASHAQTELEVVRRHAVTTAVDRAVTDGRITEADRPAWTTALNTSFVSEHAKLQALMPTRALNTANHMAGQGRRDMTPTDALNASSRITEGVTAYANEKGINISTTEGWTRAFESCRRDKPELFTAK